MQRIQKDINKRRCQKCQIQWGTVISMVRITKQWAHLHQPYQSDIEQESQLMKKGYHTGISIMVAHVHHLVYTQGMRPTCLSTRSPSIQKCSQVRTSWAEAHSRPAYLFSGQTTNASSLLTWSTNLGITPQSEIQARVQPIGVRPKPGLGRNSALRHPSDQTIHQHTKESSKQKNQIYPPGPYQAANSHKDHKRKVLGIVVPSQNTGKEQKQT